MAKATEKAKKLRERKKAEAAPESQSLPAGAIPQLVNQRIYDYLPVFYGALQEMHKELVLIRKALTEEE